MRNSEVMTSRSWWMQDMIQKLHLQQPLRIPWTEFFLPDLVWWTFSSSHAVNLVRTPPGTEETPARAVLTPQEHGTMSRIINIDVNSDLR